MSASHRVRVRRARGLPMPLPPKPKRPLGPPVLLYWGDTPIRMRADIIAAGLTWEELLDAMAAEEAGAITRCELTSLGLQDLPEPGPYGGAERRLDRHVAGGRHRRSRRRPRPERKRGELRQVLGAVEAVGLDRGADAVPGGPLRDLPAGPRRALHPRRVPEGGTVLDPFGGAGTTALVAERLQRNAILYELNPAYAKIETRRLEAYAGLFAQVAAE